MGQDTIKTLLIAGGLMLVFAWLTISLVVNLSDVYGENTSEFYGAKVNFTQYDTALTNYSDESNSTRESVGLIDTFIGDNSIFAKVKRYWNLMTLPVTIVGDTAKQTFGVPKRVIDAFYALFVFIIFFGMIRLLKQGD